MATTLEAAVHAAISTVDDPCSVRVNAPLNVFELGLVRTWTVGVDGEVVVVLSPTSPSCVLIGSIIQGIEQRVSAVPGVRTVAVELDVDTFWTTEMMSDEGRRKLDGRRAGSMARVPVRPRQWQEPRPVEGTFVLPLVEPVEAHR